MSKFLVTGCLGFIGSYFCKYVLQNIPDATIVGIDRAFTEMEARLENIPLFGEKFNIFYRDFAKHDISDLFEGVDYCFHFGAKTFINYSQTDPKPFMESNVIGTFRMLEAARNCKTLKVFFQVSTDEVYGPTGCSGAWHEGDCLTPTNPYATSKACADLIAEEYHRTCGLPIIITRLENVYGPYKNPRKVIPTWTKRVLEGKPLLIYGDGRQRRRWIHVEDVVRAMLHLLEFGKVGEIYHIAGEEEIENFELARKILTLFEKPVIIGTLDEENRTVEFVPDKYIRPFHDRRYALNVSKLKVTGWKRKYSFDEGLRQTVEWYKNNTWWLRCPESKVMIFLVYYRNEDAHKKIEEIFDEVTPKINDMRGCEITKPYDGRETKDLWDTVKNKELEFYEERLPPYK